MSRRSNALLLMLAREIETRLERRLADVETRRRETTFTLLQRTVGTARPRDAGTAERCGLSDVVGGAPDRLRTEVVG